MIPKLSRYLLVALTIITLSYVLPNIYHTLFDTRIDTPYIAYSTSEGEYYTYGQRDGKTVFTDRKGKVYTQQEFMDKTPLENFYYHLSKGTFPDSFAGVKLIPQQLQQESFFQSVEPERLDIPDYKLNALFESQPEFGLTFSKDYFRITHRIEFIDAKTNQLNQEKSKQFTAALDAEGFSYPATIQAGLPTLMKKRDEGWFIVDSKEQFFHLKMIKGAPFVRKVPVPAGLHFKYVLANDFDADEFYATIVTTDNQLLILRKKDYSFIKIPIEGYNAANMKLAIQGSMFNRTVIVNAEKGLQLFTFNRDYKLIDKHNHPLPLKSEMTIGKVAAAMFPFQLEIASPYTEFLRMHFDASNTWAWILLNLLFVVLTVVLMRREGKKISRGIPDLLIVALTGIFGFLAVHIIPNKQY
ncbi:DUF4857 domain-containing protein [Pseudoflavitalea sp. G-6-1-2]|uniref:DUF4857 domain-containing protein n=1 Tax=Pseudoflavitalea sp. G-6-1-2 TaxID=2728841 RepID=UPI001469A7BF|nr:DUF4857 domain-containing protein [Pseudoflavitalea sp. G-6-1-2]NML20883.1 DUF4857 domain-containing protein [Pseudoflavitalea sp. G-6-1-2]